MATKQTSSRHDFMDVLAHEYVFAGLRLLDCGAPLPALACAVKALHVKPALEDAMRLAETAAQRAGGPKGDEAPGEIDRLLEYTGRLDRACATQRHMMGNGLGDTLGFLVPDPAGDPQGENLSTAREDLARVAARLRAADDESQRALSAGVDNLCRGLDVTDAEIEQHRRRAPLLSSLTGHFDVAHELHNAGNQLYKCSRFEEACECYRLVLDHLNPDMLETLFNRALALTRLRRHYQALHDIDRVIELNAHLAEAHYTRGLILEYLEDYDQAMAAYRQALTVDAKYEKARVQIDLAAGRKRAKEQSGPTAPASSGRAEDHQEITDFSRYIEHPQVTLADVAGCEAAKAELRKVIAYLSPAHRDVLAEWGVELPPGVLLHGRPGCGKTLLVRACAGEVHCPVYSVPGRELVSMWAGQTERNLGHLWAEAARHESAIIHFSEFDHVAGRRTDMRDADSGEHWANRTINALLDLMDGMRGRCPGLVVIGDTNMIGNIDPALLRAGRFGVVIEVRPPADPVEWAEVWLVVLAAEERKASRIDLYDADIREVLRGDRKQWVAQTFRPNRSDLTGRDQSGIAELARLAGAKDLAPADIAEIVRRTKDERAMLRIEDEVELGPIAADDLRFHLSQYEPFRDGAPPRRDFRGTSVG